MVNARLEPGSFRDRHGRVFYIDNQVFRGLSQKALEDWKLLSKTSFFSRHSAEGTLVRSQRLEPPPDDTHGNDWAAVLQHERIPFISYPYEWSFAMLKDAAGLQLRLLREALGEELILKDASSYNIQWRGSQPVFIDIASFEPYPAGQPWSGYRQFCRLFLYPLLLQAYKGISFHAWLRGSLEGIDPEELDAVMSLRDHLRSGVFMHVHLQSRMQKRYKDTDQDARKQMSRVGFSKQLILSNISRLEKLLDGLKWEPPGSTWSDYATDNSYSDSDHQSKLEFVNRAAQSIQPELVWDLGANTGIFSRAAAQHASYVVALDADHLAVEKNYRALRNEGNRKILPLLSNLADPSPALGWKGQERKSLPERGRPDLILALALIHHIVISANIPVQDFVQWLADQASSVVIEFVTKEDPMVKTLLRNKDDQYQDYQKSVFETAIRASFQIVRQCELASGTRTLYWLTRDTDPVARSKGERFSAPQA